MRAQMLSMPSRVDTPNVQGSSPAPFSQASGSIFSGKGSGQGAQKASGQKVEGDKPPSAGLSANVGSVCSPFLAGVAPSGLFGSASSSGCGPPPAADKATKLDPTANPFTPSSAVLETLVAKVASQGALVDSVISKLEALASVGFNVGLLGPHTSLPKDLEREVLSQAGPSQAGPPAAAAQQPPQPAPKAPPAAAVPKPVPQVSDPEDSAMLATDKGVKSGTASEQLG